MKNNIQSIVENGLCTACGACVGICPRNAIRMGKNNPGFLIAKVIFKNCISCGMCLKICPSNNKNELNIAGGKPFSGNCLKGYIGYSTDKFIRQSSQSGGVVTALLCYMLDKKIIDGAIVNQFDIDSKRPQAIFAKSKKDIIKGRGSYYAQSAVVKTTLEAAKEHNVATVVLGCQALALKRIEDSYPKIKKPHLTIGLICAGQYSGKMIDDLASYKLSSKEKIRHFRFRDKDFGGWPGNVGIYTNNKKYSLSKNKRHDLKSVYESYRCQLCFDQMNIFSDIVVGDPWGIVRTDIKKGYSVFITRTEKGEQIIQEAVKNGAIQVDEIAVADILKGQTVDDRLMTNFFIAKRICQDNNWVWPYNEKEFKDINVKNQNIRIYNKLKRKLEASRNFYFEKSIKKIKKTIISKKIKIMVRNIFWFPINFAKRMLLFVYKRVKKNTK